MRTITSINNNWHFNNKYVKGMESSGICKDFEVVHLPHTTEMLPYNYFDEKVYQVTSCYKYKLALDSSFVGKVVYIRFEAVMAKAQVYLNGIFLGEHKGGYTPFQFRIDGVYDWTGSDSIITVLADASEDANIPPFGGQIDYLTYGGIYRNVSLAAYDEVHIENLKIETENVLNEKKSVKIKTWINNTFEKSCVAKLTHKLRKKDSCVIAEVTKEIKIESGINFNLCEISELNNIELWDIDAPNLYEIETSLSTDSTSDTQVNVFGFRTAEFRSDGFYLNGKHLQIVGLNRHQSYPYVGYAMPKRAQIKDADIVKYELRCNTVRTSHYPQSVEFLDRCDEIGLLVFEEIPGWQYIGNEEWKNVAQENVKEMIERDWNHPSIIIWGVRINESSDDDTFYSRTNDIARALDSSRQTGGVRCIDNSRLLEDVYTMNDFVHSGSSIALRTQREVTGLDYDVPYLVTEYNGHMFPTKKNDCEERQIEHVLRHLRVQNAAWADTHISGAVGWCAFDYNTHKDFGSGDRICYHGVMDMFRMPKFAAYAYQSQVSPDTEIILEPITFWARGERSIGGILPLYVLSNCDWISIQFGDSEPMIVTNKADELSDLPFPPFVIDSSVITPEKLGQWGMRWEDGLITGYYKDKAVKRVRLSGAPVPSKLIVKADDDTLSSAEKDVTRITICLADQYSKPLHFIAGVVTVMLSGHGKIQGPSEFPLIAGTAAFWIETIGLAGEINLSVRCREFTSNEIKINVV